MNLRPLFALLKEFEGLRLEAYKDTGGVWTIGFGTTVYPNGTNVKRGDRCTLEQANEWMTRDIETIRIPALKQHVKTQLTNNETCALLSFMYNIGVGAFAGSTLLRKLNNGFPRGAVGMEFGKWNKDNGKTLKGLVRRRVAERELFLAPDRVPIRTLA